VTRFPQHRLRRLRRTDRVREMIGETTLQVHHLIAPLFVKEGLSRPVEIEAMPGQHQHTVSSLVETLSDPQPDVRASAATALGQLGPDARAAVPALREALSDSRPLVRMLAEDALRRIDADD